MRFRFYIALLCGVATLWLGGISHSLAQSDVVAPHTSQPQLGEQQPGEQQLGEPARWLPASGEISSPTEFRPQAFDVLHYDATLDMRLAPTREMSGVCAITLRWSQDPATGPFYFNLRSLVVDSVFYEGARVEAVAEEDPSSATYRYRVDAPPGTNAGDTDVVTVYYSGTMIAEAGTQSWGGVQASSGLLYAMGVGFKNNYVSATQHWLPCYDHPSDKATFTGRFLVPVTMTVAGVGVGTQDPVPDNADWKVCVWSTKIPCATYLLTFAVGPYLPVIIQADNPPMVVYSKLIDTASTHITFKLLPRMVTTFARLFGPYPFEKVGYVNTPLGSMEHQTMVSFPTSLSQRRDTVNATGAHELAHMWFGDYVSPLDYRHAWLNESFAVYCEAAWSEELGGFAGYLKTLETKLNNYIKNDAGREGIFPLYDFPRATPSSNYPNTIYNKGGVVVGMLRYELGDSIFYNALRDYLARHAYATATTDSLKLVLEEVSGRSLEIFFKQWVYGAGWPEVRLVVTATPQGTGLQRVHVVATQILHGTTDYFTDVPVEIGFNPAGAGVASYRMLRMSGETTEATFDSVADFSSISVNKGPSLRALLQIGSVSGVPIESTPSDTGDIHFIVRPNPTDGTHQALTVTMLGAPLCDNIEYELYDSSGRRLVNGRSDSCEFFIPIGSFASGAYVLRFRFNGTYYDTPVSITK
jgi:aminopeptidase N